MGRGAFFITFEFVISLPYYTSVLAIGVPHLGTKLFSAITADNLACEGAMASSALVCLFAPMELALYHIPFCGGNNGGVAVFNVVLRHFALVDLHCFCEVVGGKTLLKPSIAFVFFVRKDALYGADLPRFLSARCGDALFGEVPCYATRGFAFNEHSVYEPYDFGFLGYDFGQTVCALAVAEELLIWKADFAFCKLFALTPSDVLGN